MIAEEARTLSHACNVSGSIPGATFCLCNVGIQDVFPPVTYFSLFELCTKNSICNICLISI